MTRLIPLIGAAVAVLFSADLPGQQKRLILDDSGQPAMAWEKLPEEFTEVQKRATTGTFDGQASGIPAEAEKCTRAIFNLPELTLQSKTTRRDEGGDNVYFLWTFGPGGVSGTLALEDTPYVSRYLLRLSSPRVDTIDELEKVLPSLLPRDQPPLLLKTLKLAHTVQDGALRVSGNLTGSQYQIIREFRFNGASQPDAWYASFLFGKGLLDAFYSEPAFVPERYPPLAELAKVWPTARLWTALHAHPNPPFMGIDFSWRDRIIAGELGRRGLSVPEIIELLRIASPREVVAVVGALEEARPGWADLYLRSALDMYDANRDPNSADSVARTAARHCSANGEAVAMDMINSRNVGAAAAHYLMQCSNSASVLNLMRKMFDSGELPKTDDFAISGMEKRIHHQ